MKLQELSLESLQVINGGIAYQEPAEGSRPSSESSYGEALTIAKNVKFIWDLIKLIR